jgi:uncharacterized protein YndB with AHSA1/START domain
MQRILTTIEINRPVEEVFGFLTNLDNAPRWTVGLVEVRVDGRLRLGTRGTDVRTMGRKQVEMPWEVTRYEPPEVVEFTYGKPLPATATFTFERTAQGTRMTCDTTVRPTGLYRLISPLIAREGRKTDALQFRKAKKLMEARSAQSPMSNIPLADSAAD